MRRTDKPWGWELVWAETDRYVGKVLHVEAGRRLSLQFHRVKDEALLVISGTVEVELEDEEGRLAARVLGPGEAFHVAPGRRHRFRAVQTCELIEVSTPELDDVVRLADDYGRSTGE